MPLSAQILSVEGFLKLGTFTAASVQRDYVWDAKHSEQLFNDIDRACSQRADEPGESGEAHVSVLEEDAGTEVHEGEPAATDWQAEDRELAPGYHLGEVMLHRLDSGRYEIFDGLQRATTLTILLCIIRDLTGSASLRTRIEDVVQADALQRMSLPGADRTLLTEIQTAGAAAKNFRRAVSERGQAHQRIAQQALHLSPELERWPPIAVRTFPA